MDGGGVLDRLTAKVIRAVRPYTMVPDDGLTTTINLTLQSIVNDIPGVLVECGTWKGGASFAMLLAQREAFGEIRRPVWMYDSFQGMGMPSELDGNHARMWRERSQTVPVDPDGQNYCKASLEEVREGLKALDLTDHAVIHKGWLEDTLVKGPKPKQIAVLRVDCDWYDPCRCVYRELGPLVSEGGAIIIDDFDAWEGCRLATYEYLAANSLPWKVRSMPGMWGAWMVKEAGAW